ncbi:MAG: glycosyltransferase family 52 [Lonepinella koalarum]|nr:glycosyltransferase family 52 [Lonepinella koalarum]
MNLIICYTPLQVLIAEKIIERHKGEDFYAVMVDSIGNKKFEYYSLRLSLKAKKFLKIKESFKSLNRLKDIICLKMKFYQLSFDKVFVASINDLYIQNIISYISFQELFTFDDGTSNIVNSGEFYESDKAGVKRKIINFLTQNKYTVRKLKNISKAHYTIFPGFSNLIENCIEVNLIAKKEVFPNLVRPTHTVNLLLGQPIYHNKVLNIELAKRVIEIFNIYQYFPHPREEYVVDGIEYIDTPLIFEDYIIQNQDKHYRVYTYFSSSVLQILEFPNVEIISLRVDTNNVSYNAVYDLFGKMGIKIIDLHK